VGGIEALARLATAPESLKLLHGSDFCLGPTLPWPLAGRHGRYWGMSCRTICLDCANWHKTARCGDRPRGAGLGKNRSFWGWAGSHASKGNPFTPTRVVARLARAAQHWRCASVEQARLYCPPRSVRRCVVLRDRAPGDCCVSRRPMRPARPLWSRPRRTRGREKREAPARMAQVSGSI
jgi:hypothetical protein